MLHVGMYVHMYVHIYVHMYVFMRVCSRMSEYHTFISSSASDPNDRAEKSPVKKLAPALYAVLNR